MDNVPCTPLHVFPSLPSVPWWEVKVNVMFIYKWKCTHSLTDWHLLKMLRHIMIYIPKQLVPRWFHSLLRFIKSFQHLNNKETRINFCISTLFFLQDIKIYRASVCVFGSWIGLFGSFVCFPIETDKNIDKVKDAFRHLVLKSKVFRRFRAFCVSCFQFWLLFSLDGRSTKSQSFKQTAGWISSAP
jgi:hypothetical protein